MQNELPYDWYKERGSAVPILISVPHSGTEFPQELNGYIRKEVIENPQDTDWLVHELYNFASNLGIPVLYAKYSRYVVDLNRDPDDVPLYNDDRFITGIFPTHSFAKEALYIEPELQAEALQEYDRKWRMDKFYWPYYRAIQDHLQMLRKTHPHVLLFDAHSIERSVPSLWEKPFPDLILGTQMGYTADSRLIDKALAVLKDSSFSVSHNEPFRGGNITRTHGNPSTGVHAMQLEMSQDIYLSDDRRSLDPAKAERLRDLLRFMFKELESVLESMQ